MSTASRPRLLVSLRKHGEHVVRADAAGAEAAGAAAVRVAEVARIAEGQRQVHLVVAHELHRLRRLGFDVGERQTGMPLAQRLDEPGQHGRRCRRKGGQAHPAGAQTLQLGELAGRGIQRRRHRRRVPGEDPAGIGEPQAATGALDEGHAEPTLRPAHVLAERRLAVAEGRGGRRDASPRRRSP